MARSKLSRRSSHAGAADRIQAERLNLARKAEGIDRVQFFAKQVPHLAPSPHSGLSALPLHRQSFKRYAALCQIGIGHHYSRGGLTSQAGGRTHVVADRMTGTLGRQADAHFGEPEVGRPALCRLTSFLSGPLTAHSRSQSPSSSTPSTCRI